MLERQGFIYRGRSARYFHLELLPTNESSQFVLFPLSSLGNQFEYFADDSIVHSSNGSFQTFDNLSEAREIYDTSRCIGSITWELCLGRSRTSTR